MASEIWSQTLSGCPSVTDSEVKRYLVDKTVSPLDMATKVFRAVSEMRKLAQYRTTLPVCFADRAFCLLKSCIEAILENKATVMLAPLPILYRLMN
jgi:hypothetical protein